MRQYSILILALILSSGLLGQTHVNYRVSFENRHLHEAEIHVTMDNLPNSSLVMQMSRTSPGRYALHEFAKNVYNVRAKDGRGNSLKITRPNPHQWQIADHDGSVTVSYTLFGDRGDGTYSEFDPTHAHMNMPATFMFPVGLEQRPIKLKVDIPEGSGWKVATQLKMLQDDLYYSPDLYYFLDSPTEVSNFMMRSFKSESNGKEFNIRLALHHNGTDDEATEYFEGVKKIVEEQRDVFGEYPDFDFGEYTFLACYTPGASGDGMEHRNSTIVTSTRSLAGGGMSRNLGTISHEFFHAWNVERIRPRSLEPFDFTRANMSGELWFAEGFTSYYTGLILARAGLQEKDSYMKNLRWTINAIANGSGRNFFTPIEMSYRAPFVDAARSVDPTNTATIFISYYTYGSGLGLALDLSLRNQPGDLNLDGYMREVWKKYGKSEIAYEIGDLETELINYAGEEFGREFFKKYIYDSESPDYKSLLKSVGVDLVQSDAQKPWMGAYLEETDKGWFMTQVPVFNGPMYNAGIGAEDLIISINGISCAGKTSAEVLAGIAPGQQVEIVYSRNGQEFKNTLTLGANPQYTIRLFEESGKKMDKYTRDRRAKWLN